MVSKIRSERMNTMNVVSLGYIFSNRIENFVAEYGSPKMPEGNSKRIASVKKVMHAIFFTTKVVIQVPVPKGKSMNAGLYTKNTSS